LIAELLIISQETPPNCIRMNSGGDLDVRLDSGVGTNFASLTKTLEGKAEVKGSRDRVSLLFKGEVVLKAINHKSMPVIQEEKPTKAFSTRSEQSAELWHR
jgi:hypothetical protein